MTIALSLKENGEIYLLMFLVGKI